MAQKNRNGADDAVSPVIGVILMVAITVILAAVIGTFVLGLGGQVQQNAQAGVTFEQGEDSVDITLSSLQRADNIYIISPKDGEGSQTCDTGWDSQSNVGSTYTVPDDCETTFTLASSGQIRVVGEYQGSRNTIQTYEIS
ncbi:type IV pilin [Halorutilales archaeon Cl-col2-1]